MIIIAITKASLSKKNGEIVSIKNNWESEPYTKIYSSQQIKNFKKLGNVAVTAERIFVGNWPGTVHGCDCLGVPRCRDGVRSYSLNTGSCSYNETYCGCRDVRSTPQRDLTQFPGEYEFFGERTLNMAFSKIYKNMMENGKCRFGYKKCGEVEGLNFGVCIPDSDSCPISSFRLGVTNPDPKIYTEEIKGNSMNVYYSFQNVKNPLTELTVQEDRVCANLRRPISPGKRDYTLMRVDGYVCDPDERYADLGENTGEKTYLDLNNVQYYFLPAFSTSDQWRYKKFARNLIPVKPNCLDVVPDILSDSAIYKKVESTFLIILIMNIILLVLLFIYFILLSSNKNSSPVDTKAILNPFYFLYMAAFMFFIGRTLSQLNDAHNWSKAISDRECFDTFTNKRLSIVSESYDGAIYVWNLIGLILLAIGVLVDLWIYCVQVDIGCNCLKPGDEKSIDLLAFEEEKKKKDKNRSTYPSLGNDETIDIKEEGGGLNYPLLEGNDAAKENAKTEGVNDDGRFNYPSADEQSGNVKEKDFAKERV